MGTAAPPSQVPAVRAAMQVVTAACRCALGNDPGHDIAALVSSVPDWPALLRCVDAHAVAPIIYAPLAQCGGVPPEPLAQLRAAVDENALRSLVLARTLREIVALLDDERIPVVPIKGPLLAQTAYGNLARRCFGDLDLVVHRRDLDRARVILADRGFQPAIQLPAGAEAAVLEADYHIVLTEPVEHVTLELHWSLIRAGLAGLRNERWIWDHSVETTALGSAMRTLTNEAMFVYLCVHGSKHVWSQLGWMCDIAALARNTTMSWTAVEQLAASVGARRMLGLGCALGEGLLGASLPVVAPQDAQVRRAAADVAARLFDAGRYASSALALQWQMRTRPMDKLAMLIDVLAAPHASDVHAVPLPGRARLLYYGLRPLRLLAARSGRLMRR